MWLRRPRWRKRRKLLPCAIFGGHYRPSPGARPLPTHRPGVVMAHIPYVPTEKAEGLLAEFVSSQSVLFST